ncbi:MAG: heme-binding protein [Pseudomonadota bacterium]
MTDLTLETAKAIIAATRAKAREMGLKPISVAVLDAGGHTTAFEREDGASNLRFQVAHGKAHGALSVGTGSRAIFERAKQQPFFVQALNGLANGALVPVPGGVLIKDANGRTLGAVGVTGDSSDNDEACAVVAIESVGLVAQVD